MNQSSGIPPSNKGQLYPPEHLLVPFNTLTQSQKWQVPMEWNDTAGIFPQERCLHHLFEDIVEREPDMLALIYQGCYWTYQELNCRANQLAHRLQTLGVGPEMLVGICVESSPEALIGLLGILKAGGAYVPLDPAYPPDRLSFMLQDTQASVLLTQQNLPPLPLLEHTAEIIYLDQKEALISQESDVNPCVEITPHNLAYVIYTSGSTARPKGVGINHRGVVNNVTDLNRRFNIGIRDRVLALSSLSFDMSVYELLGTLCAGGTVILPEAEHTRDAKHWNQLLLEQAVSIWSSAPALLHMLLTFAEEHVSAQYCKLRIALLAGDWIPVTMPARLHIFAPEVQVISLGGATEVSIYSTIHPIEENDVTLKSIPYGRPMMNQQVYVLDSQLHPAPIGVPGELYFGGVGLARGYFNNPDLTAEKFVPNPFSQEQGARLYKTGDLVCYQADGELELLGRIDHQVKIRGLRVELGEIEVTLKRHPATRDAAVLLRENPSGEKCLVAYVVPRQTASLDLIQIKGDLKKTLPDHMVPTRFVQLEVLPLSPNGKINRHALPWPVPDQVEPEKRLVAPRTPVEEVVLQTWQNICSFSQISIEDHFFESRGNSLQALQIHAHLNEIFQVNLPLTNFFDALTVAGIAALLVEAGNVAQIDVVRIAQLVLQLQQLSNEEVKHLLLTKEHIE